MIKESFENLTEMILSSRHYVQLLTTCPELIRPTLKERCSTSSTGYLLYYTAPKRNLATDSWPETYNEPFNNQRTRNVQYWLLFQK
jgi:hypothetical protein